MFFFFDSPLCKFGLISLIFFNVFVYIYFFVIFYFYLSISIYSISFHYLFLLVIFLIVGPAKILLMLFRKNIFWLLFIVACKTFYIIKAFRFYLKTSIQWCYICTSFINFVQNCLKNYKLKKINKQLYNKE